MVEIAPLAVVPTGDQTRSTIFDRSLADVPRKWLATAGPTPSALFMPAFPPKAVPANEPARREGEAGLAYLNWIRPGRSEPQLLALADGGFDGLELWRGFASTGQLDHPHRVAASVRI